MLADVHHLRVTEGVPMRNSSKPWPRSRAGLLVEFVPAADPMFAAIARGREPLYPDCVRPAFETALARRFAIERTRELPNGRVLYLAHRRTE
jgi:hypothetical protein